MSRVMGLILCGGRGTRLRPITYYFQKSMIPVGVKQKPLLEYIVRLLRHNGITELALLVNYKAEQIINYFDDGSRFGVKILYMQDDARMPGTAGSILNAYKQGILNLKNPFLAYYGDILTNMNVQGLIQHHENKKASATVALASDFTVRVGLADLDKDDKILGFEEKPKLNKPVSVGITVFSGETLKDMERLKKEKHELDLMSDVIPYLISIGKPVYGYLSEAFWYDIGSTEAYEKLDPKLIDDLLSYLV